MCDASSGHPSASVPHQPASLARFSSFEKHAFRLAPDPASVRPGCLPEPVCTLISGPPPRTFPRNRLVCIFHPSLNGVVSRGGRRRRSQNWWKHPGRTQLLRHPPVRVAEPGLHGPAAGPASHRPHVTAPGVARKPPSTPALQCFRIGLGPVRSPCCSLMLMSPLAGTCLQSDPRRLWLHVPDPV